MGARHIIAVPPANTADEVVVVEVQQEGPQPLDVRLVGCEGENPYVTSIKQRDIGPLKHKFKGSDEEWEATLSYFLLQRQPEGHPPSILDGVWMVCAVKGSDLRVSFQRDVQGIKVLLGEIVLPRDEEFEFNPFDWAQASAQAHADTLRALAELRGKATDEQSIIAQLNAQLEDFIKTKNETESAMLQQFMELLNEKKRKIRDQSRLLAGAKVDKNAASAVASTRKETKSRKAGPSRASKRKVPAKAANTAPGSDSDQMEIDQAKAEEQDEDSVPGAATPDRTSDDETEDDDEIVRSGSVLSAPQLREKSSDVRERNSTVAQPEDAAANGESDAPPPKRGLPFGRPSTRNRPAQKEPSPPLADDGDETEDEL
ncbi:hypothetical protein BDV95DRAFT_19977 [Massariosphaeria phaeospora]|uniref:Uncharacterized protein n=1 Tax=Massariosphaeria phaeospora TaxID=100035 RepID=A0A7C8MPG9_9PLEO|nr:hypothetical protein BDV95DRAFT_19977 [Massariosphaeria phaeospora]